MWGAYQQHTRNDNCCGCDTEDAETKGDFSPTRPSPHKANGAFQVAYGTTTSNHTGHMVISSPTLGPSSALRGRNFVLPSESAFAFGHSGGLFQRAPALAVQSFGRCSRGTGLPSWFILSLSWIPEPCFTIASAPLIFLELKVEKGEIPRQFMCEALRLGRCNKQRRCPVHYKNVGRKRVSTWTLTTRLPSRIHFSSCFGWALEKNGPS